MDSGEAWRCGHRPRNSVCRVVEGERHDTAFGLRLIDSEAASDQGRIGLLVTVDRDKLGAAVGRVSESKCLLGTANVNGVAPFAGVDHQFGGAGHIEAIKIDLVVPSTGDDLDLLDVKHVGKLHACAVDPLHLRAIHHLSEDVEGVCQGRADDRHRIKPGAA